MKCIETLVTMKQKNNDTLSLIDIYEKQINDSVAIANNFNNVFTSATEIVYSKIKFSNKSFKIFLSSEIKDSTNKVEIYKIISPLNSNKSCGPNSIQIKVLYLFQDQISTILQLFAIDHFPQEFFLIF